MEIQQSDKQNSSSALDLASCVKKKLLQDFTTFSIQHTINSLILLRLSLIYDILVLA
jgi:hypothetical protein